MKFKTYILTYKLRNQSDKLIQFREEYSSLLSAKINAVSKYLQNATDMTITKEQYEL